MLKWFNRKPIPIAAYFLLSLWLLLVTIFCILLSIEIRLQKPTQKPTLTTEVKSIQVFYNKVVIQGKDTTYYFEVAK